MPLIPGALRSRVGQAILKPLWIPSFVFSVAFHTFVILQCCHYLAFREITLPSLLGIPVFLALVLDQFFVQVPIRPSTLKKNLAIGVCLYVFAIAGIGFGLVGMGAPAMVDGVPSLEFGRGRQVFQIPLDEYQWRRNMDFLLLSATCLTLSSIPVIRRLPGNKPRPEELLVPR